MMTIEEKARAYDEAIERGKQIQSTPYTAHWDIMKEVAEHLLPALKESEDERIRKALVEYFKWNTQQILNDFDNKDVIVWLEKQGSQILANSAKSCKDEQMPADNEKGTKGNVREIPNSTWSEQDDINLEKAIWYVEHPAPMVVNNSMLVEWLKSLKDKVGNFDDGYKVGFSAAKHNQWIPSDEQLEALKNAIHLKPFENPSDNLLLRLYEQLKKLT